MNLISKTFATAAFMTAAAGTASAAPVVYNLALSQISTFDNTVLRTGAGLSTAQVVAGQSVYNYLDIDGNVATVSITRPDGSAVSPSGGYSSGGVSMSGSVFSIDPGSSPADPIPGWNSGLTFTFSSPVNAFGFEIGDWATCCTSEIRPQWLQDQYGVPAQGSGLWIAFDGGAATLPANALSAGDNPGVALEGSYTNFIGAIDDSGFFSSITFFGDGFGEALYAGGTLRFAAVPEGSVGDIPLPGTAALLGLGLVGIALRSSRRA
jgi:hypothetical protein